MPQKIYAVVEHPHHHARRASWNSESGIMYCGICLRGQIHPENGQSCPYCGSQVSAVFTVIAGGAPSRPALRRLSNKNIEIIAFQPPSLFCWFNPCKEAQTAGKKERPPPLLFL